MDQQCSATVKHIIKCFSCLPLHNSCPSSGVFTQGGNNARCTVAKIGGNVVMIMMLLLVSIIIYYYMNTLLYTSALLTCCLPFLYSNLPTVVVRQQCITSYRCVFKSIDYTISLCLWL